MAEIDGGGLHFKSVMDNDQMNAAIEETMRRVQGLSDGTVAGGKAMDDAFNATADNIRKALGEIGAACETHEQELQRLEAEYQELGAKASRAFMAGRDDEYRAITQQQNAVKGEITVREQLVKELRQQSNELENAASKMEENRRKTEENANTQVSMRTRIKELREEMMLLIDQGIDEQSEAYKRLEAELGRLTDIQMDVQQQARVLANDEAMFQGIITGLSGISGGFSAATGAISLFAGENDNLQKIMVKVQSLMAITIGLQQVVQTLNKDSAFQLVTMNKLKEWWNGLLVKATTAESAETTATIANTAAKKAQAAATGQAATAEAANTVATGAQTGAATAGTVANIGLAGAFRMVGLAIKSIPVFGWILAGISGVIALVSVFTSKAREAKKAQEEFNKELIEGTYKSIGAVENLSLKWNQLGDDLDAKKKFVEENKKAFDELGISVRDVADAERILNSGKDAFIAAQIAKAKAMIYVQQSTEKIKKQMELEAQIAKMSDTKTVYASYGMHGGGGYTYETENKAKAKKKKELEELKAEIKQGYQNAADEEYNGYNILQNAGIDGVNTYKVGTIGAIEQAISQKQAALKLITSNEDYKKGLEEIANLQKQLEGITGKPKQSSTSGKDPFLEKLDKYKKEYTRFNKWVNSGDETLVKAANTEFQGLLKQGATYIEYLKNQRDIILSVDIASRTKAQNKQLQALNDQIAEETKKTVLEAFNTELSEQLNNAKTTLEILNIIAQKRKELANDGTDLDNTKKDTLDDAEKNALAKQKQETDQLLQEYSSYLDKKIQLETEYSNDLALLEKRRSQATTDAERTKIDQAIANRTKQHEKDTKGTGDEDYDAMVKEFANFEQKKQAIIDDYDEKRAKAVEHNNQQLIDELNKAQAKALSSLAIGELQANPNWEKMFGNLDEISTKKLEELLSMIEGQTAFLGVDFDPKDLDIIKAKIEEIKKEIQERNPFKSLIKGIKDYSKAADDESKKKALTNTFESASQSIQLVTGALDAVIDGLETMGVEMDESTQQVMKDVGGILDGASNLAMGIASGNPLQIIQGSIDIISNGIDLIFGAHDRKAEKSIKRHAEAVSDLEDAYKKLERAINKALGGDVYAAQKAAIDNLRKQQQELYDAADDERSKKKSDESKAKEFEQQAIEVGNKTEDMLDDMVNNIISTDAKSIADQLGNAFIDAFAKGEDAAKAWGDSVNDIVAQIIRNMLIQELLQKPIGKIIDKYSDKWIDSEGNFLGFDVVKGSLGGLGKELNSLSTDFADAFKDMPEDLKNIILGKTESDSDTSLTGSIKGVSEETASLVAGQMNAIRINQMEATAMLRQQLFHLANIDNNTGAIDHNTRYIKDIYDKINSSDPLRSIGLS